MRCVCDANAKNLLYTRNNNLITPISYGQMCVGIEITFFKLPGQLFYYYSGNGTKILRAWNELINLLPASETVLMRVSSGVALCTSHGQYIEEEIISQQHEIKES